MIRKLKSKKKHLIANRLRSATYYLFNNSEIAEASGPIDANLLTYNDKTIEQDYLNKLYLSPSMTKFSDQFLGDLLLFYVYITLIFLTLGIFVLIFYSQGSISHNHMVFHLAFIFAILIGAYGILLFLNYSLKFKSRIRVFMTILGMLMYTYLILGKEDILSPIFQDSRGSSDLPLNICIIGITIALKIVLFDSFLHTFCLIIYTLCVFFILNVSISALNRGERFSQFFLLLLTFYLLLFETKILDYRSKLIFWLQTKDERTFKTTTSMKVNNDETFNSEPELLIKSCDQVQKRLKEACSVIMYKDIKDSLKLSQLELENIKQRIGSSMFNSEIKIETSLMDAEDKEFISQNFIDVGYRSEKSSNGQISVVNLYEQPQYPFSHYGIEMLESILSQVGQSWNFDVWFVKEATGKSLSIIGKYLFSKWALSDFLLEPEDKIHSFFSKVEEGYLENPYHNACHAADVLHSLLYFITKSHLQGCLTQTELICCIISSLGHDIGHPAVTNRFLVNNRSAIAIKYNDISVLESMHAAKIYKILNDPAFNILTTLSSEDWNRSRKIIIAMVLETDMSKHFEIVGKFRTRVVTLANMDVDNFEDKIQILSMALKCADIGHSAKELELHKKWTKLVCEEFFNQGDLEKERGQPVSMYCDRETTDVPKSQAGFLRNICLPLYEMWVGYLNSDVIDKTVLEQLKSNLEGWSSHRKRRETVKFPAAKIQDLKRIKSTK